MASINGTTLVVTIGGTAVSCETDTSSMNLTRDMIETTCKDSTNANKTYIPGEKDATIDVTAAYIMTPAGEGFEDIFAAWDNGTEITWTWGSTTIGDKSYTGSGLISESSIEAPQNERSTYTFTIQVTGGVTEVTNA